MSLPISIPERVAAARAGSNPTVISRVPSGWAVLCDTQFLPGYCILLADPVVSSLNDLSRSQQASFLNDMVTIGDALLEVTDAYRINYVIAGNTDPYLHAHIIPRYMSEQEELRKGLPWSHPRAEREAMVFNLQRDRPLMQRLCRVIKEHK